MPTWNFVPGIFGHTHYSCRLKINGVDLRSNQRGYPREVGVEFDPKAIVEVSRGS